MTVIFNFDLQSEADFSFFFIFTGSVSYSQNETVATIICPSDSFRTFKFLFFSTFSWKMGQLLATKQKAFLLRSIILSGTYTDRNYSKYFWMIIGRTIRTDFNKVVMSDALFFPLCINICSSINMNYLFILRIKVYKIKVFNTDGQRF